MAPPVAPPDGRWQRGQEVGAVYLADSEETAWAEWYRLLAELAVPPHRALPRDLWRFRVGLDVADLTTEARLRQVGLHAPRPTRSEWPAFQAVGEQLHIEGWAGLAVPSAARPEGLVVCLFRRALVLRGVRRLPPPRRVASAPVPPRGMTT